MKKTIAGVASLALLTGCSIGGVNIGNPDQDSFDQNYQDSAVENTEDTSPVVDSDTDIVVDETDVEEIIDPVEVIVDEETETLSGSTVDETEETATGSSEDLSVEEIIDPEVMETELTEESDVETSSGAIDDVDMVDELNVIEE